MRGPCTRKGGRLRSIVGLLAFGGLMCASAGVAAAGPTLDGVVSGSRLRAKFFDGGAGALVFDGWFDSQLGIPCHFQQVRNGQMRCVQTGQPAVWMDATCTMPVWRAECRESLPRYVTAMVSDGPAIFALGEPYTGAVHDTGNASGGWQRSCLGISGLGGSYYGMGAEIPPERFVAVTIRRMPIDDDKVSIVTMQGEDGSSQVVVEVNARRPRLSAFPAGTLSFFGSGRLRAPAYVDEHGRILVDSFDDHGRVLRFIDTQGDEPCTPVRFADGLRCVPWVTHLWKSGPYLDAGCTTPLSEARPGDRWGPTTTGGLALKSDCSVATAYTLSNVVTPAVLYIKRSSCEPSTPVAGAVYREAIPAPDSQWASVAEGME